MPLLTFSANPTGVTKDGLDVAHVIYLSSPARVLSSLDLLTTPLTNNIAPTCRGNRRVAKSGSPMGLT